MLLKKVANGQFFIELDEQNHHARLYQKAWSDGGNIACHKISPQGNRLYIYRSVTIFDETCRENEVYSLAI